LYTRKFRMRILLFCLLSLGLVAPVHGQQQASGLSNAQLQTASQNLQKVLAGPHEEPFLQILTEVRVLRDTTFDTTMVYDLVVRFDPDRYRNARVGTYPLSFEDQFILWCKRASVFTRSTRWQSGRFFLHDISAPRQAWIFTEDARTLYQPPKDDQLPKNTASLPRWLRHAYAVDPRTDLRTMSRWLRLIHEESRDQLIRRLQAEKQRRASSILQEE
jgi:hypothetical protein